jgi:predicted  nucleic acid-binding Zn-ribbon protein
LEQKKIPEKIDAAAQQLDRAKTELAKTRSALELANKEKKKNELELALCEEKITKSKSRLTDLKTNKEYQAHLHEIEAAKREQGNIEEKLLLGMDQVDQIQKELRIQDASVMVEEAQFTTTREQMDARLQADTESARQIEAAWADQSAGVPQKLLSEYKRLIVQKGSAVTQIEENTCGGCHYRLPPQLIAEVKMREKMLTCTYCNRFLYIIV